MTVAEGPRGAEEEAELELSAQGRRQALPECGSEAAAAAALGGRGELLGLLRAEDPAVAAAASSGSGAEFHGALKALQGGNRRRLLELGLRYQAKLETDREAPEEDRDLRAFFQGSGRLTLPTRLHGAPRSGNIKRFNSLTDFTVDNPEDEEKRCLFHQSHSRPKSASAAWISSITIPQPFKMTLREARKKLQLLKSHTLFETETTFNKRQSQEEAECQKQFRAQPVPAHIYLPLYQEIMEKNEIRRQMETQKRRELLLSTQRPFSFQEKEEKRKEVIRQKVREILVPTEKSGPKVRKKIPKSIYEPVFGDKLKEAELLRKIRIQMRAQDLLESSYAPIELGNRKKEKETRIASRNREQKLSFLQDNFSFRPRINTSVPDFEGLYWASQKEALCKREIREATHNKPFKLRTSALCKHQDFQQPSKTPVQRSRSLTCLSSLSSNTLPVHITDAVRKRESAIKLRQEDKKYKENEGVHWAELQRKKIQAMQKSVNCRAKAVDPHKSLEETHKEKLKQHWQNDRKKTKEYKKELEEMKIRVKNRPYLFEQVTKHGARQEAQRLFRDTLLQFGLNEEFVRKKGEAPDLVGKEQSESQRARTFQKDTDASIIQQLSQDEHREQETDDPSGRLHVPTGHSFLQSNRSLLQD
ncbi:hypothetical protein lerEdw1_004902 [Lerista edwardsae]|nr:hypothetical protein lerEdw1_004902 [Lerista edwardsae]